MDRPIIYSSEIARTYDIASGWRHSLLAQASLAADILQGGGTLTLVSGLNASGQSPGSMSINIAPGSIYELEVVDPTAIGALPPSTLQGLLQGIAPLQQVLTLTPPTLSAGQSVWALVEVQFAFLDVIPSSDPSGGVLPFYNSSNPSVPLQGQGGSGVALNSRRTAIPSFQITYGTPTTTGSEVPPNPDTGYVGLYLIDIAFGQTTISTGQILVAGPSVGTGVPNTYPRAPFIAGLTNSHHNGTPGQAPQIKLASEVQGTLPLANLPASNTTGILPVLTVSTGTPSGTFAGNQDDLYYDNTGHNLYICTTSGSASTAVWNIAVTVAGAAPTGAAGGDLAGSYPNPSVARVNGTTVPATPAAGAILAATSGTVAAWQTPATACASALIGTPSAYGLTGGNDGTTPTTKFLVTFLQALIQNAAGNIIFVPQQVNLACLVVGTQSGSVAGGRDQTAAFGPNTFFHLYLIGGNGNTPALLASTSYFGFVYPGTYNASAYLGTFRTNGSALLTMMYLRGNNVTYQDPPNALSGGFATSPTALALGTWVPAQALRAQLTFLGNTIGNNASTLNAYVGQASAASYQFGGGVGGVVSPTTVGYGGYIDVPNVTVYYAWNMNGASNGNGASVAVGSYTVPNASS